MKIHYNVSGPARKAFAVTVSEILNLPLRYLGMPTASYQVGSYTITRTGELTHEGGIGSVQNSDLLAQLQLCGYSGTVIDRGDDEEIPDYSDLKMTEREELGLGRERRDHRGEDGIQASDVPEPEIVYREEWMDYWNMLRWDDDEAETIKPDHSINPADDSHDLVIEMPRAQFTDLAITNLRKIVASKEGLIKKALGADSLPIEVTDDRIRFPWFTLTGREIPDAYTYLICALCDMAKKQKRVTAKEREIDNDKFAMRLFLIRLGFIGPQYKAARKILLQNLTGNSAWKYGQRPRRNETRNDGNDAGETSASVAPAVDVVNTEVVRYREK